MRRIHVALVLVLAATLVAMPAVGQTVTTVDENHALTDRETIQSFEQEELATANLSSPNMRLTVAESNSAVGLDTWHLDMGKRYLRVQYNESIERTVRFYVPSEYWYPVASLDDSAMNADQTADFRPTDDGRYTAVTIEFDGRTDAVWSVSIPQRFWFWTKSETRERIQNQTGYEPPQIGSSGEWQYVPNGQLDGAASYPVNASNGATIQYDTTAREETATWLSVPECSGEDVPVCQYDREGVDDMTYVLSKSNGAPPVRWKQGSDPRAFGSSAVNDVLSSFDRGIESIRSLFGGV